MILSLGERRFERGAFLAGVSAPTVSRCLGSLAGASVIFLALPSCSEPGRSAALKPLDPESRAGLGQSFVDATGRWVAALPPGRPLREISLYDLEAGTVRRLVDPDEHADYSDERVALSRDGRTLFAIRRYDRIGRYAYLVAIDLDAQTITPLRSRAAGYVSLAPDATGRYLFYFRDVAERLDVRGGGPAAAFERSSDHSAPGPYRQLARYDLASGREDLQSRLIFKDGARLTATSRRLIFSTGNAYPDFEASYGGGKQGEALDRFALAPAAVSPADPADVAPRNLDSYRTSLPVSLGEAVGVAKMARKRPEDFGLLGGDVQAGEFEFGRLQVSDDERALLGSVRSDEYCWGVRSPGGATSCRSLEGDPASNLRIAMSFDGGSVVLSRSAPVRLGGVTWCRISYEASVTACRWRADKSFEEKIITLKSGSR
ncbi:MAG: hypothetical protein QM608_15855 [Caulobacter sp.]